ncbi:type II toxin-antitoxin system VapC family toxin [Candidatus Gottesmanbacteria bacterium]|nr:type II toxin-antitoxin system VapC family toxin [Candidatus Gottesmanbacteria bacterium]
MDENTKFVVDASFVLAFLLPDEATSVIEKYFDAYKARKINFISSVLLPFEVLNGLKTGLLRRRNSPEKIEELAGKFIKLNIQIEENDYLGTLKTALSYNLTFYDAAYLHLAQVQDLPLLTLDKQLKKVSR